MTLNHGFIIRCKRMTLQFVVLKPLLAILSLIFMLSGHFEEHWWQYTLVVVYNISYSLAIYYLVLYYLATKTLLQGFHAVGKFAAVKIIVFATYYQSLLVAAVPGMDVLGSSESWNDFILCVEMALFAIMHMKVFSHKEFKPDAGIMQRFAVTDDGAPINVVNDTRLSKVCERACDTIQASQVDPAGSLTSYPM